MNQFFLKTTILFLHFIVYVYQVNERHYDKKKINCHKHFWEQTQMAFDKCTKKPVKEASKQLRVAASGEGFQGPLALFSVSFREWGYQLNQQIQ